MIHKGRNMMSYWKQYYWRSTTLIIRFQFTLETVRLQTEHEIENAPFGKIVKAGIYVEICQNYFD